VNDRLDVAVAVGADGVQLGAGSLDVAAARRLGPAWLVGRSVHAVADAHAARAAGADYLLAGPVFATATHPGAPPLGLDALGAIVAVGLPVIAIGGVTLAGIPALRAAGAWGAAAIRALWDAGDPAQAARAMEDALQR
jgi:thiamine-phosphate pyrophosphorylase